MKDFFKEYGLNPVIRLQGANNQVRVLFDYENKVLNTDFIGDWAQVEDAYRDNFSYDEVGGEDWELAYLILNEATPLPKERPDSNLDEVWKNICAQEILINQVVLGQETKYELPRKK